MPDDALRRPDFADRLVREVEEVLRDPKVAAAPIQARLLAYLCEQTIGESRSGLTQYAVAVDALGRREDFDITSESYPRVQISRLRKTLETHYTHYQPAEGLCISILHGDYKLRLAPIERAYPDLAQPAPPPAVPEPAPPPSPLPESVHWLVRETARNRRLAYVGFTALLLLAMAVVYLALKGRDAPARVSDSPPMISVVLPKSAPTELGRLATSLQFYVDQSIVARLAPNGPSSGVYSLTLRPGENAPGTVNMTFKDERDARTLMSRTLPLASLSTPESGELAGLMADILSVDGLLAKNEAERIGSDPRTGYECFIAMEQRRATGGDVAAEAGRCLLKFRESRFAPYFMVREAIVLAQRERAKGEVIVEDGPAWILASRAVERDRYNPFANVVLARILIHNGKCSAARPLVKTIFDRPFSAPAVNAALFVDLAACQGVIITPKESTAALERLAAASEGGEATQSLYMTVAALAYGREDLIDRYNLLLDLDSSQGDIDTTRDLLRKVLRGKPTQEDRRVLARKLRSYVWSDVVLARIEAALSKT